MLLAINVNLINCSLLTLLPVFILSLLILDFVFEILPPFTSSNYDTTTPHIK